MYKRSGECYQTFLWTKADFSAFKDSMSLSKLVCVSLFAMSCEVIDAFSCRITSSLGSSSARFALQNHVRGW
jgi:hypothetical protein